MKHFATDIAKLQSAAVLVIGDVMLDTFIYGDVNRISPEAPIPILSVRDQKTMAGGAANVALNVTALGASSVVIGIVGDDDAGRLLHQLLNSGEGRSRPELVTDPVRPTTVKSRYVGNNQQILRADRERADSASPKIEEALIAKVRACLPAADAVAISDYAKGVLTDRVLAEIMRLSKSLDLPVIVDPKRARWDAYKGASVIKPNLQELLRATGRDVHHAGEADRAASEIVAMLGANVLLTRSRDGMSLYCKDHDPVHARAVTHEVFDVSGAGDTTLAAFATALAAGIAPDTAVHMANLAAGVAVTKLGTAVVTSDELARAYASEELLLDAPQRILDAKSAAGVIERWKAKGLRVGFTNGCFDILHAGHVTMLSKAAEACDRLIVALNSDASVRRLKGPSRPVQTESSRTQVIAALQAASLVTVFGEDTPIELIKLFRPDVLFKGADYKEDEVVGGDLVKSWGGRVLLIELTPGLSTTNVIGRARTIG
jgi:D-beta-D-heptose 7-phosphate kinase/D-beta-D-heptose 1-phosphate adenosyltransferase